MTTGPPPNGTVLAVDIGGTKLHVALVDPTGGVLAEGRAATAGDDGHALFAVLAELIDSVRASAPRGVPLGCGVGCGGPMDASLGLVSPLNIEQWRGFPLQEELARHTGLATFLDNDAKALALGEGWLGAAVGVRDFVAMVVSTGVGGGLVVDGRLLDGRSGNAGHIGHVIVEPEGRPCRCGARGCLEAEASGPSIAAAIGRPAAEADAATVERTGRLVGRAVASVANLLDLRLASIAGSVALGYGAPFFAAAQAEIDRSAQLDFSAGTRVVPAGLGTRAPIIGAAAVARRALGQEIGVG